MRHLSRLCLFQCLVALIEYQAVHVHLLSAHTCTSNLETFQSHDCPDYRSFTTPETLYYNNTKMYL